MFVTRSALFTALLSLSSVAAAESDTGIEDPAAVGSEAPVARDNANGPGNKAESTAKTEEAEVQIKPGVLPTIAAVVPGLLLHGAGHYAAGDKKTALKLLKWQALGVGLGVVSAAFLRYSGGSRYGNELSIPMAVSGAGLIINTFIADVYGSAGGSRILGYKEPGSQAASLSYAYIHDPQFSYRHFSRVSARFVHQSFRIEPLLWTALDDDNQRARLPVRYRFLSNRSGEYLEATSAFTYHHFGSESFSTYLGEASLGARVEMRRLGESLRGSFTTMSVGAGYQTTAYGVDGVSSDSIGLLLGHFGYGFYLPRAGEIETYYEHRRDTFTAGSSPSSRNGSGFLGHFGVRMRQPLSKRFVLQAQAEIGSAYLLTGGLEVQWGQN